MSRTDVHQHLWPEALLGALSRRRTSPLIRRSGVRLIVRLPGEPDCELDLRDHDPGLRRAQLERDEVQRALICLSSPLGIEALPREEAAPLLHAYNTGVLELGGPFDAWGAVAVQSPDPDDVDAVLDAGAVGVCLPAGALRCPSSLQRCAAILSRLEQRGAPLFVHPGPGPSDVAPLAQAGADPSAPAWWPAMTQYVADMNAAWHAFAVDGRARHPRLRVVFAMLAGGAPLHLERLASRDGPTEAIADTGLFYDTSSYGVRTIDALVRCVGIDQLVYGSDRPVVDAQSPATLGRAASAAITGANVTRLLEERALSAPLAA